MSRLDLFFNVLKDELSLLHCKSEPQKFAAERQRERMRKRARSTKSELEGQAVAAFLATNALVRDTKVTLDRQILADARHFITVMLERYTARQDEGEIQNPLLLSHLFDLWRFGPGTSYGVKGTHCAEKIQQPMTCTASSELLVKMLRRTNPYLHRFDSDSEMGGTSVVQGSRLATVPKNEDTMRTIAVEPSGSMCLQLAAGEYLTGTLRLIGLDISRQQPINKAKAQSGSIDGRLATIDLKSASDMISCELVRLLFPTQWYELLMLLRSEQIEIEKGSWVELNMISTMGNGFTFPLMTLIITALIYGFRAQRGGPNLFLDWADTCVYGDDIIIPTHEYSGFTQVLQDAGLVVNHDKSFSAGPFRESCGGDFFEGVDVTPFYIKELDTAQQVYVALNQLLGWCAKTKIVLHASLTQLVSYLDGKAFFVPEWHNPDEGILSAQCSRRYKYLQRASRSIELPNGNPFGIMLAVGGYVAESRYVDDESGSHLCYTPRSNNAKVSVRKGRLPRGYLSGWDARKRTRLESEFVSMLIEAIL